MANWANTARLGDPSSPEWQKKNLAMIEPVPGQRWQVYQPAAASFEGFLRELAGTGYKLNSSGGFNYRPIRGGTSLSQHAFGTAIDLNAATNPRLTPGAAVVTDLPANIGDLAARYNLEWGGNWKRPDAMHFEWRGDGSAVPSPGLIASTPPLGTKSPSIASMYNGPGPAPAASPSAPLMPQGNQFGALASLFMQQQVRQSERRAEEQEAEQARRAALFGGGIASLYG